MRLAVMCEPEPLEAKLAEMRELLLQIRPESGAAALSALRRAFPEASLADRVRALGISAY